MLRRQLVYEVTFRRFWTTSRQPVLNTLDWRGM